MIVRHKTKTERLEALEDRIITVDGRATAALDIAQEAKVKANNAMNRAADAARGLGVPPSLYYNYPRDNYNYNYPLGSAERELELRFGERGPRSYEEACARIYHLRRQVVQLEDAVQYDRYNPPKVIVKEVIKEVPVTGSILPWDVTKRDYKVGDKVTLDGRVFKRVSAYQPTMSRPSSVTFGNRRVCPDWMELI